MQRPFSNNARGYGKRMRKPFSPEPRRNLPKYPQLNLTSPQKSNNRRVSRNSKIESEFWSLKAKMIQVKNIRNLEEEKSRMLNTFIPSPSYSRWVVKGTERFEGNIRVQSSSLEKTSTDEGNANFYLFISSYNFLKFI